MSEDKKLVIIDTDGGVDDAIAMVVALSKYAADVKNLEVLAITTVHGNVEVEIASENVLRILNVCERQDIPVYEGSQKSLLGGFKDAKYFHGKDGLGDAGHKYPVNGLKIQEKKAALRLVELAKKYSKKLSIIALGPLTNIALAHRIDSSFTKNLKEIFLMGGNIKGIGNETSTAEFNFCSDPEAAKIVLTESSTKVTIMPWETCCERKHEWTWEQYYEWLKEDNARTEFIKSVRAKITKRYNVLGRGYYCCDSWAMGIFMDRDVIKEIKSVEATVECTGQLTRGLMVVDKRSFVTHTPNVDVIAKLHPHKMLALFKYALK